MNSIRSTWTRLSPAQKALLWVGVLFLPGVPAYIWMWPKVSGGYGTLANILSYGYILAGTLWIGRRFYTWNELGVNRQGIPLSLACGLSIIAGRTLVIISVDWQLLPPQFSAARLAGEFLFYLGLVGVTEELLFRGLIYRAILAWRGEKWAVWGSSLGFVLWHIFGGGPLVGAAMLLYGLIFALIRYRAGGILGLIVAHGLIDFTALLLLPDLDVVGLGRPQISHPLWLWVGLLLIVLTPVYLWKIHPMIERISCRSGQ